MHDIGIQHPCRCGCNPDVWETFVKQNTLSTYEVNRDGNQVKLLTCNVHLKFPYSMRYLSHQSYMRFIKAGLFYVMFT